MEGPLSATECYAERRRFIANAKAPVFEFRMLDWYYIPDELALLDNLEHGVPVDKLDQAFDGVFADYSPLDVLKARGVQFTLVHAVSVPFTNYVELEADHDRRIEEHGGSVLFIEKQKFFDMQVPKGIEIRDFIMSEGSVLLLNYETDRKARVYTVSCTRLTDGDAIALYRTLSESLARAATPLKDFMADPRLKLKPTRIEQQCAVCGNNSAWIIYYGIRIGDEPPLIITKCTECGNTTRTGVG